MIKELKGLELTETALRMLQGDEKVDYSLYLMDTAWWTIRLYLVRN